ncbi:MAG: tetratricopeptide repeat protein [Bacteroidales bacterium]|nr:tetratricopeptide repeat protein [Bacteroidales bacterium]
MKTIFLALTCSFIALAVFAQTDPNINNAYNSLKNGYLDEALDYIDKVESNPKNAKFYKTYYYKGMIYQEIAITENEKYKSLCDNCLDIAFDSYLKSINLNLVNPEHKSLDLTSDAGLVQFIDILQQGDERNYESSEALVDVLRNRLPALTNAFVNSGVNYYKKGDYEKAYSDFSKAITISTLSFIVDGELYYLAVRAAIKTKRFEEVISLSEILQQLDYGQDDGIKVEIVLNHAIAYRETGEIDKMIKVLEDGIIKYPTANYPLVIEMFNHYVNKGENQKAFEYINLAIEKNNQNPQFYVIRATLSEGLNLKDNAIADYKKAIELDVNNFDAIYSLGAIYYNMGVDTLQYAENNVPVTNTQEYEKYKLIANKCFADALPYLEKAQAIKPNELPVLTTLKTIYYRLSDMEKYNAISAKINALTK